MTEIDAGGRFHDRTAWEHGGDAEPHIWATLGFRRTRWEPGIAGVGWDATAEYGFPARGGHVVHGGMVTTLLDSAMGGACWTVLEADQAFLTADLRVEFLRPSRPGPLVATGRVLRRTRRVIFCTADLEDSDGVLLATARCTQVVLPADGPAGRYDPPS